MIADREVSIRQAITEDPEFTDEPKLYVITDEPIPGDLLTDLKDLAFVRRVGIE